MITIYRNDDDLVGHATIKSFYINKKGDSFDITATESYAYSEAEDRDAILYAKLLIGKGFNLTDALDIVKREVNEGLAQGYSLSPKKKTTKDVQVSAES